MQLWEWKIFNQQLTATSVEITSMQQIFFTIGDQRRRLKKNVVPARFEVQVMKNYGKHKFGNLILKLYSIKIVIYLLTFQAKDIEIISDERPGFMKNVVPARVKVQVMQKIREIMFEIGDYTYKFLNIFSKKLIFFNG